MAFGKSSTNSNDFGPNAKFYYVTIKQKELPAPIFEVRQKTGDKEYTIVDPAAKFLSGDLISIRNKEGKTKADKTIKSFVATFIDKDDVYFLTLQQDYLSWNILNSLLALKSYKGIEIGLYQSKPKAGKTKTYASAGTRQAGELVYGKFKNEDLPEIPRHQIGEDFISDKTKVIAFYQAQVEEFSKVLKAANPAKAKASEQQSSADSAPTEEDNGNPEEEVLRDAEGNPIPF